MAETKEFPLGAILTGTTGVMLCEGGFGEFHKLAEWLCNGPVWTHEMGNKQWADMIARELVRQHPTLPTDAPTLTPATFRAWVAEQKAIHGERLAVTGIPDYGRTKSPLETLAEVAGDKPMTVLNTP